MYDGSSWQSWRVGILAKIRVKLIDSLGFRIPANGYWSTRNSYLILAQEIRHQLQTLCMCIYPFLRCFPGFMCYKKRWSHRTPTAHELAMFATHDPRSNDPRVL